MYISLESKTNVEEGSGEDVIEVMNFHSPCSYETCFSGLCSSGL